MNDTELNHRVTEILGFEILEMFDDPLNEWAIAGALMGRMDRRMLIVSFLGNCSNPRWHLLDQLRNPRAIIEASVRALS